MITKINISALKSIKQLELNCKKLNIITGTNSSGKSTTLQAILLFFQAGLNINLYDKNLGLNGDLVALGEFRENKNFNSEDKEINIQIDFNNYEKCSALLSFHDYEKIKSTFDPLDKDSFFNLARDFTNNIFQLGYLSCHRIGANDVYSKSYLNNGIGQNGEYAIHHLEQNKSNPLEKKLIKDPSSETLSTQVNYWLQYIINSKITTEDIRGTDIVKASYSVGDGISVRPKNVGSGVSYLISIIILCLTAKQNNIVIIENPEIHLHPKAQSKICEFLYFIAEAGIQVFVETHSDHIFNGIRAGIAVDEMDANNIAVNFFELDEKRSTKNTVVEFGAKGRVLNYTKNMFDQFDVDLDRMLGL